jgi:hypothetical protein
MEMVQRILIGLCVFAVAAAAVDVSGTWKLNTAKSKYTGMPSPKDLSVTYTPQGSGWKYEARGTTATGEPINGSFMYKKDGEEIKTTGFPMWDGLVLENAMGERATGKLLRGGKPVGTVTRTLSSDGKTMTVRGSVMGTDGKKATYVSVYEKQ